MWHLKVIFMTGLAINAPADLTLKRDGYKTMGECMSAATSYALALEQVTEKDKGGLTITCEFKNQITGYYNITPGTPLLQTK